MTLPNETPKPRTRHLTSRELAAVKLTIQPDRIGVSELRKMNVSYLRKRNRKIHAPQVIHGKAMRPIAAILPYDVFMTLQNLLQRVAR